MLKTSHWDDADREEWESALYEAFGSSDRSGTRVDRLVQIVCDGIQAHRVWANIIWREAAREGLRIFLTQFIQRNRRIVYHDGATHQKSRAGGARRTDSEGESYFTQTLFDLMTLDELREKREEYLKQIAAYNVDVAMIDRLIALCELAEKATPTEAAAALGTTVDEWLAS